MRAVDRPNYPRADKRGTYGCTHCGNYARLEIGMKLKCSLCLYVKPMVPVAVEGDQQGSDTPNPPESTRETDTYSDSSGSSH